MKVKVIKIIYSIFVIAFMLVITTNVYGYSGGSSIVSNGNSSGSNTSGSVDQVDVDPTDPGRHNLTIKTCAGFEGTCSNRFQSSNPSQTLCATCQAKKDKKAQEEYEQKVDQIKGTGGATNPTSKPSNNNTSNKNEEESSKKTQIGGSASDPDGGADITNPITNPEAYKPGVNTGTKGKKLGNKIVGIIQTIGVVISVVGALLLGIKYMFGSVSERAEYKKTMVPYIVGLVLLFASSTIVGLIYNLLQEL